MSEEEIISICENNIAGRVMNIPSELLNQIDEVQAYLVRDHFKGKYFLKLPDYEIEFFEWLKLSEPEVWQDLWSDSVEEPYLVSIDFLPTLLPGRRGFPICDLVAADNYYFAPIHINGREAELMVDTIKQRYLNKKSITVAQTLLMEISMDAIDIWHFAYKHKIEIAKAKEAVALLVEEQSIVHFTNADHLANFVII